MLLLLIFVSTVITLPILQSTSVGAKTFDEMLPGEKVLSNIYLKAIAFCFSRGGVGANVSPDGDELADTTDIFAEADVLIGIYMKDHIKLDSDNKYGNAESAYKAMTDCQRRDLVSNALSLWGISLRELLCNVGYRTKAPEQSLALKATPSPQTLDGCLKDPILTNESFYNYSYNGTELSAKFTTYINDTVGSHVLTTVEEYVFYRHTLAQSCIPGIETETNGETETIAGGESTYYNGIKWARVDKSPPDYVTLNFRGVLESSVMVAIGLYNVATYDPNDANSVSCADIVQRMNDAASGFVEWAEANPEEAKKDDELSKKTGTGVSACGIEQVGWLVCPVTNWLARLADATFNFLASNFLETKTEIFKGTTSTVNYNEQMSYLGFGAKTTLNESPTFAAWKVMRTIANIAFVIAFLIVIFSQITSIGITNYGIKKMLPRLIIAAILVNLSYYICQIAVDLSNILGWSIKTFLDGIAADVGYATAAERTAVAGSITSGSGTFSTITLSLLSTVTVVGGVWAAWSSLAALIPVVIAAVVACLMILLILVARQALIIILIIISPIAFVAFLLPNTMSLFTKWQKALTAMLILFPIVALVFGASSFASSMLAIVYQDTVAGSKMGAIVAAAVMALPLFIVPGLLKKSLDGIGTIGAKISGFGDKIGGSAGKWGAGKYGESALGRGQELRKIAKADFKAGQFAKIATSDGLRGRLARGLGKGESGRFQSDYVRAAANAQVRNAEAKELANQSLVLQAGMDASSNGKDHLQEVAKNGNALEKKAAYHMMGKLGMDGDLRKAKKSLTGKTDAKSVQEMTNLNSAISANSGELLKSAPDLIKESKAWDNVTAEGLTGYSKETVDEYMTHLSGLANNPAKATEYAAAKEMFNAALTNIQNNSQLVSKFKADRGAAIIAGAGNARLSTAGIIETGGGIKFKQP